MGYSYVAYGDMQNSGSTNDSRAYTGKEFDGLGIDYYPRRYYRSEFQMSRLRGHAEPHGRSKSVLIREDLVRERPRWHRTIRGGSLVRVSGYEHLVNTSFELARATAPRLTSI